MILVLSILYVVMSALVLPCIVVSVVFDNQLWMKKFSHRDQVIIMVWYSAASVAVALPLTVAVIVTWGSLSW